MTIINQAGFSKMHGVSRKTVSGWKARGWIVLEGDDVDVEASNALLTRYRKGGKKGVTRKAPGNTSGNTLSTKGNSLGNTGNTSIKVTNSDGETVDQAARRALAASTDDMTFDQARLMKEKYLALLNQFEYERKSGQVIDLDVAEAVFFELFRAQRDAWMNWPIRVGPVLAADLGLEAEAVTEALTALVHKQISSLGNPEPNFDET